MAGSAISLKSTDALLVIDMQNDFCPGGSLAVTGGDEVIAGINVLAAKFEHIVLTQDWHPAGHISFASSHPGKQAFVDTVEANYGAQTLWPEHCLQGSRGAEIHGGLELGRAELIVRKGFRVGVDSYSAFLENDHFTPTGLAGYLRERGLERLFFVGLAYDFCVGNSAIDGAKMGFECVVVTDLSRAVGLPGTIEKIEAGFAELGVAVVDSDVIA